MARAERKRVSKRDTRQHVVALASMHCITALPAACACALQCSSPRQPRPHVALELHQLVVQLPAARLCTGHCRFQRGNLAEHACQHLLLVADAQADGTLLQRLQLVCSKGGEQRWGNRSAS